MRHVGCLPLLGISEIPSTNHNKTNTFTRGSCWGTELISFWVFCPVTILVKSVLIWRALHFHNREEKSSFGVKERMSCSLTLAWRSWWGRTWKQSSGGASPGCWLHCRWIVHRDSFLAASHRSELQIPLCELGALAVFCYAFPTFFDSCWVWEETLCLLLRMQPSPARAQGARSQCPQRSHFCPPIAVRAAASSSFHLVIWVSEIQTHLCRFLLFLSLHLRATATIWKVLHFKALGSQGLCMRIADLLCSDAFVLSTEYLSAYLDLCLCNTALCGWS